MQTRYLAAAAAIAAMALTGCRSEVTAPPTSPRPPAVATALTPAPPPVVALPSTDLPPALATAPTPAPPPVVALPSTDLPPGPIYHCETRGVRVPIVFEPRVDELCRRHPEMGPCQYERNACRKSGGRVFTAQGEEITPAIEARYDERVRRVRLQSDGKQK